MKRYLALLSLLISTMVGFAQEASAIDNKDGVAKDKKIYFGLGYNFLTSVPAEVENFGASLNIRAGYMKEVWSKESRDFGIAVGGGLGFNHFETNLRIDARDSDEAIYRISDKRFLSGNYFFTLTLEAPLEFRWRFAGVDGPNFYRLYTGINLNYALWTRSDGGTVSRLKHVNGLEDFTKLNMRLTALFGIGRLNLTVAYQITNMFNSNARLQANGEKIGLKPLTVGVLVYIL